MDALTRRLADYEAHIREKYTDDDRDTMAKAGEAMPDGSFPIKDGEDLENAIHAVGRGNADHDKIRLHVIKRAEALGLSDKIPDNWDKSTGALTDAKKAAEWDEQHRGGLSYGDLSDLLQSAIASEFAGKKDWSYVLDFTDDSVIYCLNDETFQVSYALDGDTVTFDGKPATVRPQTTWVPLDVESKSAKRDKPTDEDPGIANLIAQAHNAVAQAVAAQLQDPDNDSDPDDADVMAGLKSAQSALAKALTAQTKDGHKDKKSAPDLGEHRDGYQPVAYHRQPGENVKCPECGKFDGDDAKYCDQCGFQLTGATVGGTQNYEPEVYARGAGDDVWCPICAKANADDAIFCDQCGKRLEGADSVTIGETEGMASATDAPAPRSNKIPAMPKRAFSSFSERSPAHECQFEFRAAGAGDAGDESAAGFLGYASTTGQGYGVVDWLGEYRESIEPGAFAKTLREQTNVPLLFNHDGFPLASTESGTSSLSEDKMGLRNEAVLDLLQPTGMEVYRCLRRGTLNKMSFSFRAVKDTWNDAYDDRSVNELKLFDTSVVTYPANPNTTAELREAMRMTLGREGLGVMWSARSAFATVQQRHVLPVDAEPVVEKALRAIFAADEQMARQFGSQGRARTFIVAQALYSLRQGKVLSSGNETLLKTALNSLQDAADGINQVIANNATDPAENDGNDNGDTNDEGMDYSGDAGGPGSPGSGNPLMPQDGLGPRVGNTGPRSDRMPDSVKRALAKIAAARSLQ